MNSAVSRFGLVFTLFTLPLASAYAEPGAEKGDSAETCAVGLSIRSNTPEYIGSYDFSEVKAVETELLQSRNIRLDRYPKPWPQPAGVDFALELKVDAKNRIARGVLKTLHFVSNTGKPDDSAGSAINERILAQLPKECPGCSLQELLAVTLRSLPTCAEIKRHKVNRHGPQIVGIGAKVAWADEFLETPEKRALYVRTIQDFVTRADHSEDQRISELLQMQANMRAEFDRQLQGTLREIRSSEFNRDYNVKKTCESAGEFATQVYRCAPPLPAPAADPTSGAGSAQK